MVYTVKQLAQISGVSVRTLHWYDEKGLLKPANIGANGYRYYHKDQLLILQQILFFKMLGFGLKDIQRLLMQQDFDKVKALNAHKQLIKANLENQQKLLVTLDKTIQYLEGNTMINLESIFDGLTEDKQAFYVNYLLQHGVDLSVKTQLQQARDEWTAEQWLAHKASIDEVYEQLAQLLSENIASDDKQVQALIDKHYHLTCQLWRPDQKSYIVLGQLYGADADWVEYWQSLHPDFLVFLQKAMQYYANNQLKK